MYNYDERATFMRSENEETGTKAQHELADKQTALYILRSAIDWLDLNWERLLEESKKKAPSSFNDERHDLPDDEHDDDEWAYWDDREDRDYWVDRWEDR